MVIDREIGQEMRCLGKRVDKNNWDGGSGAKPPYEVYFLVHSAPSGSSFSILSSGFFSPKSPTQNPGPARSRKVWVGVGDSDGTFGKLSPKRITET